MDNLYYQKLNKILGKGLAYEPQDASPSLAAVRGSRSPNTAKAYRQALGAFSQVLLEQGLDLSSPPSALPEDAIAWYADAL